MQPAEPANARVERAASLVVLAATVWFALAVSWGLFAIIGGGHDAQTATRAIVAENMRAWHILAPVKDYVVARPTPDQYYVHHPWGMFWGIAALAEVLGRGTWVPRLAGVMLSVAIPPLLYGIGRRLWGPIPGALSALAYVVLPIALSFGNLPTFEVPVIFSVLLATWGYLRFTEGWRRKWMLVSLAGVLATANSDWMGYTFIGTSLGALAIGVLLLPRWYGRVPLRPFAQWWALATTITAVTLVGYGAFFQHIGAIENLLHAESQRARGTELPLDVVLRVRRYWIDVSFTPLVVTVGKIAAPIFLARVLFWRRLNEIFPLAMLVMATLEYVMFKNGADVHIYWPLPFAPYWALSVGMLAATAMGTARWILARRGRMDERGLVPAIALGVFGLLALVVLPDGIRALHFAKATNGRFNEKGGLILGDVDMAQAMGWMAGRMAPGTVVQMHESIMKREYRGLEWQLHRPLKDIASTPFFGGVPEERYYVADLRFLNGEEQRRIASAFPIVTLGPYLLVDREAPKAPLEAYGFEEREPTFLEWYFTSPAEPIRTVRPDPWRTWELREHFGQTPNPPPAGAPRTLDEIRIAHNVAVATGDVAAAEKWKAQLLAGLDVSVAAGFADGTRLLGKRFVRGVAPKLELYFEANNALADDYLFEVVSVIDRRPPLSLVPGDDKMKKYGPPFVVSPRLWRKGFIYLDRLDVRHRPGRERFAGFFEVQGRMPAPPPRALAGDEVPLMTIE